MGALGDQMFMEETQMRASEIEPDPRFDVIECARADGAPGPEMECKGVLGEEGLNWAVRGRCDDMEAAPHPGPVLLLHFRGQIC